MTDPWFQMKEPDVNEDEEVDIVNVEKDSAFSDSDASQDELCFLPAIPCPDIIEQQDKCIEISSKMIENNNSGSPPSEEAGVNGRTTNHASSPLEGNNSLAQLIVFSSNVCCWVHTIYISCFVCYPTKRTLGPSFLRN